MMGFLRRFRGPVTASHLPAGLLPKRLVSAAAASKPSVAVFWDIDNKPPNCIHPYDAAVRLKLAASSLGPVRFCVAYANHHAFRHVRAVRRARDRRESSHPSPEPYPCRICGRNFFAHAKLVDHFHQIHEREHAKRLHRLDSARGGRRVRLAAQLALKMEKYEKASRELLVPRVGYSLADELRRAGVVVRTVEDRPDAADRALREHIVDTMDRGKIGCLVLVSDDSGFLGVLREARMRCLKTVVVGDEGDGALKRCADANFSWKDVISGKARKEAESAVGKWKDRELLKRLEWTYDSDLEETKGVFERESEDEGDEDGRFGLVRNRWSKDSKPWWKLDSDSHDSNLRLCPSCRHWIYADEGCEVL